MRTRNPNVGVGIFREQNLTFDNAQIYPDCFGGENDIILRNLDH